MMPGTSLRRRIALWLCPDLAQVETAVPAPVREARVEHVIRLGHLFLAGHDASNFIEAVGFVSRRGGSRYDPRRGVGDPLRWEAGGCCNDWRRIVARPPSRVTDKTYDRLMQFFAAHWPEGAPWPGDIPRPIPKQKACE